MSGLLNSLQSAGDSLQVYQRSLQVVQNNISNASTPGYAQQYVNLGEVIYDPVYGLAGGVALRSLVSARDEFAEQEVQRQSQSLGFLDGQSESLAQVEKLFPAGAEAGLTGSLNRMFAAFSAWSSNPTNGATREAVLASAGDVAGQISGLATSIATMAGGLDKQINGTVSEINQLAGEVARYNEVAAGRTAGDRAGLDSSAYAALERLSQLIDVDTLQNADGTIQVTLKNGTPLVAGTQAYELRAEPVPGNSVLQSLAIVDWQGQPVTGAIRGGELGGLLDTRLRVVGGLIGDATQAGSLNQLASGLADTLNGILTSGRLTTDPASPNGAPLFVYDPANPATSLRLNPGITRDTLAAVDPAGTANGIPMRIASLATSTAEGSVNGLTFGGFFGEIMAGVGRDVAGARLRRTQQESVTLQAKGLRDKVSGVSLDEQAVLMIQFQRSYEAVARLLTTVNDLTELTINLGR